MNATVARADADASLAPLRSPVGVALIAGTVFASGVASYDAYVVNVAVPAIGQRFDAGVAAIQWTLTSYLLAVAALLLIAGALADRFGRRRMLVIGLLVMGVASILCASATSIETLIAARAVQGIGAAFVVPTSLALLNGSAAAQRPGTRDRRLGRAVDARDHRGPVRRRLAGRPRLVALGVPAQPPADRAGAWRRCSGCPRPAASAARSRSTRSARCSRCSASAG